MNAQADSERAGREKFSSLFGPEEVICHLAARGPEEAFGSILEVLARGHEIGDLEAVRKALVAREASGSTVIAPGIAVPHARLENLSQLVVSIATSREGIEFGPPGQEKVKLVVLVLAPKAEPALYLQAISSFAAICQEGGVAEKVSRLNSREEVWRFFQRNGATLAGYVRAADIMAPVGETLDEHDTLARAIDVIARRRLPDVPVLDHEGDMLGVVSAHELLRVCLPDYLLWIEDPSPILQFESFADVLKCEGTAWLADILSRDYAHVTEDAPAIQVAREIVKRGAKEVFVLRAGKPVGVIEPQHFVRKVLRE